MDAGASSYVTKAAGIAELRAAIRRTAPGGCPRKPAPTTVSQIVGRLQEFVRERTDCDAPTPQQARVLQLAAEGLTYREIARRLVLSEATVRFHIQNLKLKYAATSKTDLIVRAIHLWSRHPAGARRRAMTFPEGLDLSGVSRLAMAELHADAVLVESGSGGRIASSTGRPPTSCSRRPGPARAG